MLQPVFIAHPLLRTIALRARHCYLLKTHMSCDHLNEDVTTAYGLIFGILMFLKGKQQSFNALLVLHAAVSTEEHACVVLGDNPHTVSQCPAGHVTQPLLSARPFTCTARLACLLRD